MIQADGQSFGHTVVGVAVDFGLIAITKFIPVVGWITLWYDMGNLLDKLDGKYLIYVNRHKIYGTK